jgi:bifunctional enzyme CysN/CysC
LAAVQRDSAVHGTTNTDFDPALLTDGLKAEREQGITIDVAYRYFSTPSASSSSPTAPATSSTPATWPPAPPPATWPIILIDARHGVLPQTKRHSFIASLLGIRHVVVAVNKMDLVDYAEAVFARIRATTRASPPSWNRCRHALHPDFRAEGRQRGGSQCEQMPWYQGPRCWRTWKT